MSECARDGCGHVEESHEFGDGRCYAYTGESPTMCTCSAFVAEQPALAAVIAAGVASFGESFEPVLEAVNGYRRKLLAADYPAPIAARMAADYHAALLRTLTSSTSATDEGETTT